MNHAWISDLGSPAPRWIWADRPEEPDAWVAFRRDVDLDSVPGSAPAIIAADTKYWLWVNGSLVVREGGLKRGPTPDDGYADRIDLAPWLRPGRNRIAILVWHLGHDGASHRDSGRGGLLAVIDAGPTRIVSDRSWRARRHPGFDHRGPRRPGPMAQLIAGDAHFESDSRGVSVTLSEWSVRFDARLDMPGWTGAEAEVEAPLWPPAIDLGSPPDQPWGRLAPRPIPFWRDSDERPYPVLSHPLPCDGPARVVARLPANLQVLPTAVITARAGDELVIAIGRDAKTTTWVARGGSEAVAVLAWGNGEEVVYDVPAGMRLEAAAWRETGYACDQAGILTSDDAVLDRLWRKTARSVHINMRDSWSDCPDRERSPWPGDIANAIAFAACTLDPAALPLTAKTLREFAAWAAPDGNLWGAVPTGRFRGGFREFPAQSLALISLGLPEYVMQSGDLALAGDIWPEVRRYLLDLHQLDDSDLVRHRGPDATAWGMGVQCWYDWGGGADQRLLDQGWYALALRRVGELAELIGAADDATACRARHARLATAVRSRLWDPARGAFASREGVPDERGNALLILAGVATPAQGTAIAGWMSTQDMASIYMERHVLEALCEAGRGDAALARIHRRYGAVAADAATTLPEHFGGAGNHAWGGAPALIAARHLCGLRPLAPGWRRFALAPDLAAPAGFTVELATIPGRIRVVSRRDPGRWRLEVEVPAGCTAVVRLPAGYCPERCELEPGAHALSAGLAGG